MLSEKSVSAGLKFATKNLPRHLVGAAGILIALYVIDKIFSDEIPTGNREIALVILGLVIGWSDRVFAFHFGSSSGSKEKTEQMGSVQEELLDKSVQPNGYLGPPPSSRPDIIAPEYKTYEQEDEQLD